MIRSYYRNASPALKITLLYVIVGCLWILFSDTVLGLLVDDARLMQQLQTFKGWAYVLITGGLFYGLMQRAFNRLKATQANLDESRKHYSNLFRNNPQVMWVCEMSTGRIIEANHAATREYGYGEREFENMRLQDLNAEADHRGEKFSAFLEDTSDRFHRIKDIRHKRKNGEVIDVEVLLHHLPAHTVTGISWWRHWMCRSA
jgi:PAS domain S-box-containing protein